jgi:hypothetical protein
MGVNGTMKYKIMITEVHKRYIIVDADSIHDAIYLSNKKTPGEWEKIPIDKTDIIVRKLQEET